MQDARNCSREDYSGPGNSKITYEYEADLSTDQCPYGLITDADNCFMDLFHQTHYPMYSEYGVSYIPHCLPCPGSLLEQPHLLIDGMAIVKNTMVGINNERQEEQRAISAKERSKKDS